MNRKKLIIRNISITLASILTTSLMSGFVMAADNQNDKAIVSPWKSELITPEFQGKSEPPDSDLVLWYRQPAERWLQALPLGNGRLGAMIFGKVNRERIQLNEETLWAGGPKDRHNPNAQKSLPEVRRLLFEGKYKEASDLAKKDLLGVPERIDPYQSLGDLWIDIEPQKTVTDYRRELDMESGIIRIQYRAGAALFMREFFISAPDNILVGRFTCDKPGGITARFCFTRQQDAVYHTQQPNRLILEGQCDNGKGLKFQASLSLNNHGGSVNLLNNEIQVEKADEIIIYLAGATNYRGDDPQSVCDSQLLNAGKKSYEQLRVNAIEDHEKYFNRVELSLEKPDRRDMPTDERLRAVKNGGDDPYLIAQYFQLARYLLIASSRPGCLPANLQGLWCEDMKPPWSCDYHLNINLQMNYWPAEVCNLSDCASPLFDYIDTLREPGRETARVHYGCRGFVAHHLSDVWGFTVPADGVWGLWPMGAAWLCQHLWEHYQFTGDLEFLKQRAYPTMKEAALFFLDFLIEDSQGRLVTNPSTSPENRLRSADGVESFLCVGASMDFEIIHDLFTHCIKASELLRMDAKFRKKLITTLDRIPQPQTGKHNQLQEWLEDFDEAEPGHRHMSHLFAFYPGDQITLNKTPQLAEAVRGLIGA